MAHPPEPFFKATHNTYAPASAGMRKSPWALRPKEERRHRPSYPFSPWPTGRSASEDGSYRIAKVPVGEVKILVNSPPLDPAKAGRKPPKRPGVEAREGPGPSRTDKQKKTWREIPARYGDATASDLRHTIAASLNPHDVKMDCGRHLPQAPL